MVKKGKRDEYSFEIQEHIGVFENSKRETKGGVKWQREVNLVSWNGNPAKIDIREWNENHDMMSKGSVFTEEEAKELLKILTEYFEK